MIATMFGKWFVLGWYKGITSIYGHWNLHFAWATCLHFCIWVHFLCHEVTFKSQHMVLSMD